MLDHVDLEVARGEITALLGPNGAGKSTLMRIIATVMEPTSGTIRIDEVDRVDDPAAARRVLGMVIGDERSHYWRISGRENIAFFTRLRGVPRDEALERADELLSLVDLADAADQPVLEYSSGMRARLSLARSLIGDPAFLLLDEPTRSLDPSAAMGFRRLAAGLTRSQGAGMLIATHDLHEVAAIADQVVVLQKGRVVLRMKTRGVDIAALESAYMTAVEDQSSPR